MTEYAGIKDADRSSDAIPHAGNLSALLPLVIFLMIAIASRDGCPSWIFMWTMAFAIYAGCKWLTLTGALLKRSVNLTAAALYLCAWHGMVAKAFLNTTGPVPKPSPPEWLFAAARALLGTLLVWFVPRIVGPSHPIFSAWSGMVGVILILHFGLFHLLALC